MREIKFRAWDKENKQWLRDSFLLCSYGGKDNSIEISTESCGTEHGQRDCDIDLMQFTGLHDSRGVEIYEGDIVEFIDLPAGEKALCTGEVIFEEFGWHFTNSITESSLACYDSEYLNVIGNIHENPSLLEEN